MHNQTVTHFHVCGGVGSGAAGFNDADPSIGPVRGRMVCVGGVDVEAKRRARKLLNRAVGRGQVVPQPCESCSAPKAQGHHDDYSKPLQVRWLCAGCHSKLHNQKHPLTKACEVCRSVFTPHPTKRARAKTCSPACRMVAIKRGLARNPPRPPWTKLDDEKAAQIRQACAAGHNRRALAVRFDVHKSQIDAIARGRAWTARAA